MEVQVHCTKITKPTASREEGQILKSEEEDAKPSARCEDAEGHREGEFYKRRQKLTRQIREYDGVHPKAPLDLAKETRNEVVEFMERSRVKSGSNKLAQ